MTIRRAMLAVVLAILTALAPTATIFGTPKVPSYEGKMLTFPNTKSNLAMYASFSATLVAAQVAADQASASPAQADTRPLGERAWDVNRYLAVDIGSRPAGSEAEREAARYLAGQLSSMGYAAELMPFDLTGRTVGTSQNVVARSPSESPTAPLVIVGAHYDSVPAGPGANDNGSGTATMIEVARELARNPAPGVAVRFVAFGAEEMGLQGSAAYVRSLPEAERNRVQLAFSLDMLAVGTESQFAGSDPWVAEAMARSEAAGVPSVDGTSLQRGLSDHQSFIDAGMPAILFHAEPDNAYHTDRDVIERVQVDYLDLMGSIALNLIRLVH